MKRNRFPGFLLASVLVAALLAMGCASTRTNAERRYIAAGEKLPKPGRIIVHDFAGSIVEANDKMVHLLGYPREALVRMKIPELHPPESQEACRTAFQRIAEAGACRFEAAFRRGQRQVDSRQLAH